jgi:hypothetical protein
MVWKSPGPLHNTLNRVFLLVRPCQPALSQPLARLHNPMTRRGTRNEAGHRGPSPTHCSFVRDLIRPAWGSCRSVWRKTNTVAHEDSLAVLFRLVLFWTTVCSPNVTPDIGMPSFGKVGGERSGWISCWRNMPGGGGSRCREEGKASLAVFLCLIAELQVILMVCACRSVSWAITRESNCGPMSPRQPNGHI